MVEAYKKTERQDLAGTVIDQNIIEFLKEKKISPDDYLEKFSKKYKIPYKVGSEGVKYDEYAYRLISGAIGLIIGDLGGYLMGFYDRRKKNENQRILKKYNLMFITLLILSSMVLSFILYLLINIYPKSLHLDFRLIRNNLNCMSSSMLKTKNHLLTSL